MKIEIGSGGFDPDREHDDPHAHDFDGLQIHFRVLKGKRFDDIAIGYSGDKWQVNFGVENSFKDATPAGVDVLTKFEDENGETILLQLSDQTTTLLHSIWMLTGYYRYLFGCGELTFEEAGDQIGYGLHALKEIAERDEEKRKGLLISRLASDEAVNILHAIYQQLSDYWNEKRWNQELARATFVLNHVYLN